MIVIEDDFYPNPDEVREQALQQFFHPGVKGKKVLFAGQRTNGSFSAENRLYCKSRISKLINRNIITFPVNNSNSSFTLGKELRGDKKYANWIHHDRGNHEKDRLKAFGGVMWAAVCYLNPKPLEGHGTGLFRSRKTNSVWVVPEFKYEGHPTFSGEWKGKDKDFHLHTYCDNLYNRIIIYPATYWHAPFNAGFGHDKYTGRLIQVFFFWAESSGVKRGYEWC